MIPNYHSSSHQSIKYFLAQHIRNIILSDIKSSETTLIFPVAISADADVKVYVFVRQHGQNEKFFFSLDVLRLSLCQRG